jgi:hypothetical protein
MRPRLEPWFSSMVGPVGVCRHASPEGRQLDRDRRRLVLPLLDGRAPRRRARVEHECLIGSGLCRAVEMSHSRSVGLVPVPASPDVEQAGTTPGYQSGPSPGEDADVRDRAKKRSE